MPRRRIRTAEPQRVEWRDYFTRIPFTAPPDPEPSPIGLEAPRPRSWESSVYAYPGPVWIVCDYAANSRHALPVKVNNDYMKQYGIDKHTWTVLCIRCAGEHNYEDMDINEAHDKALEDGYSNYGGMWVCGTCKNILTTPNAPPRPLRA